jgi:hypothetical protein
MLYQIAAACMLNTTNYQNCNTNRHTEFTTTTTPSRTAKGCGKAIHRTTA